ncbi:HisH Glutamine amidotransferase [Candidatus Nanopelagicaceae bacterium]
MKIGLIDYGAGNLGSMRSALTQINLDFVNIFTADKISEVDALIIPGVGAFNSGMRNLNLKDLPNEIIEFAKTGKKVLGICLGMHLLATSGNEGGHSLGLNLIPGEITKLTKSNRNRVPHVGWDSIISNHRDRKDFVYFAHSYYYALSSNANCETISSYQWDEILLPAIIKKDNVIGIQFHPEKSHDFGLKLLRESLA